MPRKKAIKKLIVKRIKAGMKKGGKQGLKKGIKMGVVDPFKRGLKVAAVLVPGVALVPKLKTTTKRKKK